MKNKFYPMENVGKPKEKIKPVVVKPCGKARGWTLMLYIIMQ